MAERLMWMSEALHAASAVSAAHQLGLLAALASGPLRAEEAARHVHGDVRRTAVLLEALAAMRLVESSDDGSFRAAVPEVSVLGALAASAELVVHAVRTGEAPLECDVPAGATRVYPDVVTYLATVFADAAESVADLLHGADRVLDVGAGGAPWSLAFMRRNPRCRVTALDLTAVLPATRRAVGAAGYADRFDYLGGDVFDVSLSPATFDLVLVGNLCHLFDASMNARLFRRLRPAVADGGRVAVIDVLPSQDGATRRSVSLYAVGLMTRTKGGEVHGKDAYRRWLEEAGFSDIRFHEVSRMPPTSVVTGSAT